LLEIRLLGSPQVTIDGEPIDVDTRKAIALLAYLAVEGSADRDALTGLFWAESSPERARATLRRTLSALRGGIGSDAIAADRNRISLAGERTVDLVEFESALEGTKDHGHDAGDVCAECVAPLTRASTLYRADFLGAFAVRGAPEFEDWARSVAESLRLAAGEVLRRLAMAHAGTGDYQAAIGAANRWVELDELHEPAHRLTMLLNAWAGDRPGSIQAYRNCVAILDRELGVSPLEETTELYEAILDEDLPPAPGLPRQVKAHPSPPTPPPAELLDRVEAVGGIERAIDEAEAESQLLIITGDSWMGKTRLIEHGVSYARERGHHVISTSAFRAETQLPYGVAIQILEGLISVAERATTDLPEWVIEELARLDPRLTPGVAPIDLGQMGQVRLREAFLTLAESAASVAPIVLVVDDAQWADKASASLLAYVGVRLSGIGALVVISTRDNGSLPAALREMVMDADHEIALLPMRSTDLADMYPEADLTEIIQSTGGIPLLVREAIESGEVSPDDATVTKYMESRRQRISALGRQVMAAAAVLHGMCDPILLRETSGRTDDEIVEAVEELISSGLLKEHDDGRMGFTLDVLEPVTYESTSLIRRRLLHKRAAGAIAAQPRSGSDVRMVTAVAEHLHASGSDDAARWYRAAGDLARSVYANDEATSAYENALALGDPEPGGLRVALGELAMARGDYETAMSELRAAASMSSDTTLALAEHRIGDLNRLLGRFELAEESFVRAEAEHPKPGDLYADWALLRHRLDDGRGAVHRANQARELAEPDDPAGRARALNILGVVSADPHEALGHIDQALTLTEPDDPARMAALNNKARVLGVMGRPEEAVALVEEGIAIADKAGYRHHQAALLNHRADLEHQMGAEEEAEQSLTEAVRIFADIVAGDWEPEVWLLREW
jgi:DNA-binding SARP family transcriptional activator/Flp pilus assembly protein TadD